MVSLYLQIGVVSGIIVGIVLIIIWRLRTHKSTVGSINTTPDVPKNVTSIAKKYNMKISSNGIILTRFVSKTEMEEIKQSLLPLGYIWDEEYEKFVQTGGLTSLDAKSIIEVFDLFDERILKLEKAVLGNQLSDPSVSLPTDIKPLLVRMQKLEELSSVSKPTNPVKIEEKKEEIDLSFFSQPRTPDEIVQKFNYPTKQGLYMKLSSYGLLRDGEGNYYFPEKK